VPPLAAPASAASAPVGKVLRKEFLLVVSGPDELVGRTFELAKVEVRVGRQAQLDVPINMSVVSREHAVLQQRARGVWLLKDLKSANGTFVDGVRITDTVLRTGDRFSIGQSITLQLSAADALDETAHDSDADRGQDLSVYQALRIQCEKDATGAVLLVRLSGRVDVCSYAAMSERLRQAIDAGERLVLIDLQNVEFMDHAGLGILVQTLNRLKSLRGDLRLVGAREWMKETFTLSRLDTLFGNRLVDDERAALAELIATVRRR
jgi:anti-anti-sigma factor